MGAQGGGEEEWPSCDIVTLFQRRTSKLMERWSWAPAFCVVPAQLFLWPCAEPDPSHFSSPLLCYLSG